MAPQVAKGPKDEHPTVMTFDILEKKKAGGAAALSLGSELIITHGAHYNEKFEDLDEVLANFVAPYMRNFNAVVNHRKFAPGNLEDIQNAAHQQCVSPCNLSPLVLSSAVPYKYLGMKNLPLG